MRTEPILSTYGHTHLDCMLLVFGSVTGSLLSAESLGQFSSELSAVGAVNPRSASSARSFARLGLVPSASGVSRMGSLLPPFDVAMSDLPVPLRNTAQADKKSPAFDVCSLGSPPPARSCMRSGPPASQYGALFGSSSSLLDSAWLGLSVLVRSLTCLGPALLPVDYAAPGPSSLVRSHARFGSTISVQETIQLNRDSTYIKYGTTLELNDQNIQTLYDTIQVYARATDGTSKRGIGIRGGGGRLHGSWVADNTVSTSDRRLKKSIVPLYKAIETEGEEGAQASSVSWVLRQLRPVSFKFKQGPEAKYSRYGFVAQELQQVLPSLVRKVEDDHLAVVYQDLIALLTAAAQMLQEKVTKQEEKISKLELELNKLNAKMDLLLAGQPQKVPDIAV